MGTSTSSEEHHDKSAHVAVRAKRIPPHRKLIFWIAALVILMLILFVQKSRLFSHEEKETSTARSVVITTVKKSNFPVYLTALGAVTPTYNVTIKTQINGTLMRVLFREGQMVKRGEVIAEIDDRIYQAQLIEYQGQLLRDQALLDNANIDLKRYQTLWKQDSISQQTLATQIALVKQYEGAVQLDRGLIAITQVNLIYCKIISPVDGRIGLRLVDPGNYVQTTDTTGIAIINTLNPITVVFAIPEDSIPALLKRVYAHLTYAVLAYDRQQNKLLGQGTLLTMDNQINSTTGTVNLKAQFDNTANQFFPSQFVNIRLLVKTLLNATIVPTAAIQYGTKGHFVYVLNLDKRVSVKRVIVGPSLANNTVITSGVIPGQWVVIEGADDLTDGAKVIVHMPKTLAQVKSSDNRRSDHPWSRRFAKSQVVTAYGIIS